MRIANVKTESSSETIPVIITSLDKPEIAEEIQLKWQKIADLVTRLIGVPSGLINRLHEGELEVFLSSKTPGNPFQSKSKLELGLGWYCESVAGTRSGQLIPNALKLEGWKNNPSIPHNIISYMGLPILWPDGEVFGTFCVLDNKENHYSDIFNDLLKAFVEILQTDLNSILLYEQAKNDVARKETELREVHHCIKNQFNLLISTIYLESKNKGKNMDTVLTEIQTRIKSISLIHDKLYNCVNMEGLLLGKYLTELGNYIITTFSETKVNFMCSSESIGVSHRTSVTIGLILNELITNSLKYAFKGNNNPEIILELKKEASGEITFLYRDNGIGLPENFNIKDLDSLGIKLIGQSVKQLDGSFEMLNDNGFLFKATLMK
ncbi:MAG: histidine kinase dimerization/phosphoacceptor domain -containing protein [Ignavibacteriaceae bacterium]